MSVDADRRREAIEHQARIRFERHERNHPDKPHDIGEGYSLTESLLDVSVEHIIRLEGDVDKLKRRLDEVAKDAKKGVSAYHLTQPIA